MKTTACNCHRRDFLQACLSGAAVLGITSVSATLLSACGGSGGSSPTTSVPNSSGNNYSFSFSTYPDLENVGGALLATVNATSGSVPVAVVRTGTTSVVALNATCTHQGCTINDYDASSQSFTCPCHGSKFSETGAVLNGPASRALASYTAQLTTTGVTVTIA